MRHQARLGRDGLHQVLVGLDGIDRTDPEAGEIRHQPQDAHHQIAQARRAGQVRPPACQIDAGQDHLVVAAPDQPLDLIDHDTRRYAARIAAPEGDDAKGAAMIAAVLHLHIGARAGAEAVDQMARRFRDRHDVVDLHPLSLTHEISGHVGPGCSLHLFGIADHPVNLGHGGKGFRLGLGGAAGHDQRGIGVLPAQAADVLARLAHRLGCHGAGVHDHQTR